MPCFRPRPAWKNEDGITFINRESQLDNDYMIPCGKCLGCQKRKRRDWAVRLYHESKYHERNSFVTLTYADPPAKLQKRDVQLFIKRLRKESRQPLKYFITGEYGDLTHRPHYHAIIFGEDYLGGSIPIDYQLYTNPHLERIWKHGQVAVGEFTIQSASYVCGYVNKKLSDTDTFSLMSRNPPIGWKWARDHQEEVARLKTVMIGDQSYGVPKVYYDWTEESKFRPAKVWLDDVSSSHTHIEEEFEHLVNQEINERSRLCQKMGKI